MKNPATTPDWLIARFKGARVLVIDDERVQCDHIGQTVREWEVEAVTAQTLSDALRLFREKKPDLVLLDVVMPHVDGYKVAQIFKRESAFVPIILLTGLDDLESKRRGLAAGADEFLTKPVNPVELQIRMASMLRVKRLADELESANKKLALMATVDQLTQVANRRLLDTRLPDEYSRARRYHRPLTVVMVDIDHFKSVNDNHGHPVGDKVLSEVAFAIKQSVRGTDVVGRYGGEEFMVIAPETNAEAARVLCERIRTAIIAQTSSRADIPAVTASLGVATTELSVNSTEELVKRADEALYQAKRQGRDRVVLA